MCRRVRACIKDSNIRAARTRRGLLTSAASPRWKAERAGFAFASGLAATATILDLLDSGDHVIASDDLYGGTYRLFERVRRRSAGLAFSYVDMTNIGKRACRRYVRRRG